MIKLDERLQEGQSPLECGDDELRDWYLQFVKAEQGIGGEEISA